MDPIFFDGWAPIFRTVVVGVFGYAGMVLLLRLSGKRTLSKLNMFDFIITIAFGSIIASMMLTSKTTLAQGLAAFATLVLLQFAFTFTAVRWKGFERLIKAEPRLLFHDGQDVETAQKEERITRTEIHAAVRSQGLGSLSEVHSVVLETNGDLTVIPRSGIGKGTSLPSKVDEASLPRPSHVS